MICVIKTGDADSNAYILKNEVIKLYEGKYTHKKIYYCDEPNQFESFLNATQSMSLFATESNLYILHDLKVTANEKKLLSKIETENIILVDPSTKVFPKSANIKIFDTPLKSYELKRIIADRITKLQLQSIVSADAVLQSIGMYDVMGNVTYSPIQAEIVLKQIETLAKRNQTDLIKDFIAKKEFIDHWQITNMLFADKKTRTKYFDELMQISEIYEVLGTIKTNLLLMGVIATALLDHMDDASIAKTLGKHPFFVGNLITSIKRYSLSPSKLSQLLSRFINLEMKLKTGSLDDPELGFSIVIATIGS